MHDDIVRNSIAAAVFLLFAIALVLVMP